MQVFISKYNKTTTSLSTGEKIEGSFILDDTGENEVIDIQITAEQFLLDPLNYKILAKYIHKKEILLVGCGNNFIIPSLIIKKHIQDLGFKLEWMPTESAYHTFNLLSEDYRSCIAVFIKN